LTDLTLAELQSLQPAIGPDVYEVLSLQGSMNARQVPGGTAPVQVRAQIERHRLRLSPPGG
jgi:argininosuccinate lyase